jgi:uncharacterized membrane protein
VGVTLLALSLRLFHLGAWSFWHDEALTILLAGKPIDQLVAITAADVHPPLYFLVVKLFMRLGQTEFVIRLPSALCGAGSVWGLYLAGRDLFEERVGLMAAFILAVSPLQLFYAQEARMYTQLTLLTIFSSWCFRRALRDDNRYWWGMFVVGAVLALYTAYFALPILGAMGLYILGVDRRRERIIHFLLAVGLIILLYLPWLGVFLSQTRAVLETYWMAAPSPLALFTTLAAFFVGYTLPPFWVAVSLAATLLILFVTLNSTRHAMQKGVDRQPLIWLLLWGFGPLLGIFFLSLARPIFQLRTVLVAAPAFYLLVAWGVTRARHQQLHLWLFLPALVLIFMSMFHLYFDPAFAKPNWRGAARYVQERVQAGDVVLHTSPGSFLPFLAYRPTVEHVLLPDPVIVAENAPSQQIVAAVSGPYQPADEAVQGHRRAWLVIGLDQSVEYQAQQKAALDERYVLLEEAQIEGVYIFTYVLSH